MNTGGTIYSWTGGVGWGGVREGLGGFTVANSPLDDTKDCLLVHCVNGFPGVTAQFC